VIEVDARQIGESAVGGARIAKEMEGTVSRVVVRAATIVYESAIARRRVIEEFSTAPRIEGATARTGAV